MRLALTVLFFVAILATPASGVVETSASTNSFLITNNSELAAARLISKSSVESPEIYYNSSGQVDSFVIQPGGGDAIISQQVYSTFHNYYGLLGGGVSFSSKVTATNATGPEVVMTGKSTGEVCYSQDYAMMRSQTFGMGIAHPGDGD